MEKKHRDLVMANLYFKNNNFKLAESSYKNYLTTAPQDFNALKSLAQCYEAMKKHDLALECYEQCYQLHPSRTTILLDICRILHLTQNKEPNKWFDLATKHFPSNPIVADYKARSPPSPREPTQTDILPQILEELRLINSRLAALELKIEQPKAVQGKVVHPIVTEEKAPPQPIPSQAKVVAHQIPAKENTAQTNIANEKLEQPKAVNEKLFQLAPARELSFGDQSKSSAKPETPVTPAAAAPKPLATTPSLFSSFSSAKPASGSPSLFSSFSPAKPQASLFSSFSPALPQPAPPASKESSAETAPLSQPLFTFGSSAAPPSGNFFSDGLKKLNLPAQGSWTKPPSTFSFSQPEENSDETVPNEELPIENTCTMKPIEVKTGEEDEDIIFEQRCKLFRLRDKEYKERGLGNVKVLKHKTKGTGRLIMRREAIGLVCLNCWDCSKIERVRETQIRWLGMDASDGQAEPTVFLVKFKTPELADKFQSHLESLFSEEKTGNDIKPDVDPKPEVELVNPVLDNDLVEKAKALQLPDVFYHTLPNQKPCTGCDGCNDDE